MATKYTDLYIRSTLNDPGTVPRSTSGLSSSPDVIPYGIMPVNNPDTFFTTTDAMKTVMSKDIIYDAYNYIYLRGVNQAAGPTTGNMYAYFCPSNLLLYPSTWQKNVLYTQDGIDHVPVSAGATGTGFATPIPLLWRAPFPPPNSHFCMIARVTTEANKNPIPPTGGYSDFATWIAGNGGLGWRNVTVVDAGSPEIVYTSDYDQEEEPGLMDILVTTNGAPIGSEVWFSSGTPLGSGKFVAIPPTKITQDPQTWGTQAYIPSQWKTTFTGGYRSNGGKPGPGFDISLRVQFAPPATSRLYALGMPVKEHGLGDWHMFDRETNEYVHHDSFFRRNADAFASGPIRPVLLGSVTLRGATKDNPVASFGRRFAP
jgi:hypothetical protein